MKNFERVIEENNSKEIISVFNNLSKNEQEFLIKYNDFYLIKNIWFYTYYICKYKIRSINRDKYFDILEFFIQKAMEFKVFNAFFKVIENNRYSCNIFTNMSRTLLNDMFQNALIKNCYAIVETILFQNRTQLKYILIFGENLIFRAACGLGHIGIVKTLSYYMHSNKHSKLSHETRLEAFHRGFQIALEHNHFYIASFIKQILDELKAWNFNRDYTKNRTYIKKRPWIALSDELIDLGIHPNVSVVLKKLCDKGYTPEFARKKMVELQNGLLKCHDTNDFEDLIKQYGKLEMTRHLLNLPEDIKKLIYKEIGINFRDTVSSCKQQSLKIYSVSEIYSKKYKT